MTEFVIGLASWVLQDGNYSNFKTGETRRFALEIGDDTFQPTRSDEPLRCDPLDGYRYDAVGEVIHDGTVIDFGGLRATTYFQLSKVKHPRVGERLAGRVSLFVDPFFYFDEMAEQDGMVPAIHTWRIDRIELDKTPMVWVNRKDPRVPSKYRKAVETQRRFRVREDDAQVWRTIDKTRMWKDEEDGWVAGSYRLTCTLLPEPPTLSL